MEVPEHILDYVSDHFLELNRKLAAAEEVKEKALLRAEIAEQEQETLRKCRSADRLERRLEAAYGEIRRLKRVADNQERRADRLREKLQDAELKLLGSADELDVDHLEAKLHNREVVILNLRAEIAELNAKLSDKQ